MNPTDWLPGMAAVLATATSFLFSGSLLRRLLMESWAGPPALLATLTIAISSMVVVSGALGVIGLLIFGSRLPMVGRNIGKSITEFKKGMKDAGEELSKEDSQAAQRPQLSDDQMERATQEAMRRLKSEQAAQQK